MQNTNKTIPENLTYFMIGAFLIYDIIIAYLANNFNYTCSSYSACWAIMPPRLLLPCIASILFLLIAKFHYKVPLKRFGIFWGIGEQSLKYWIKFSLVIAPIFAILVIASFNILKYLGTDLITFTGKVELGFILNSTIFPISEELLFRAIFLTLVASLWNWKYAIISGGILFAFYHFLYGNLSPDNFLAGFLLGWIFYKSRSVIVPFIFHIAGNLIVCAFYALAYHYPCILDWIIFY